MFDATARINDFIGAHSRVADKDDLVVLRIGAQHFPKVRFFCVTTPIVFPNTLVHAVVEIKILEMLEFGSTRGKHLFADANMVVHRSADIEEQQNLHLIVPLGYQFEIEVAAVVSCRFDRVRQIKFGGRAFTGKFSKPSKRDLNVADTDLDAIVEVFEFPLIPNLYRAAVA